MLQDCDDRATAGTSQNDPLPKRPQDKTAIKKAKTAPVVFTSDTSSFNNNTIQYNESIYNARMVSLRAESEARIMLMDIVLIWLLCVCCVYEA